MAANLAGDLTVCGKPPCPTVVDPSTGLPYPDQTHVGPISAVATNMAQFLPVGSEDATGQVTFATPLKQDFNEYIGRFDQVIRKQDRLFARVYIDRYKHAPTYDNKNLLTVGPGSTVTTQNYAVGYTMILSPSLVNNLVLDVVRAASDRGQGGNVPQMNDFGANVWQLPKE